MKRPIAYKGRRFTIAYAVDRNGRPPGKEFFEALPMEDQAKLMRLFALLANQGRIDNPQKFGNLKGGLREFKCFQIRMPCCFLPRGLVVITHGFRKKRNRTAREEILRAWRILKEDGQRAERAHLEGLRS